MLVSLLRPSPGRTWKKRFRSFFRKSLLVLESAAFAAAIAGAWWVVFWKNGIRFDHESEVRTSTIILVLLVPLGCIAAEAAGKVVDQSVEKSRGVRRRDEYDFMTIRDIRIPIRLHMFLGATFIAIEFLISIIGYGT